jgi:formylmethanofuran dehydrogenase subunit C
MKEFSMNKLCLALLACLPLAALAGEGSVSKVNGSVRVEAGQSAGDVSTVNGSVTIEEGATAADVETVNGSVNIERNATVRSVESVNGGVSLAANAKADSVETVNGTLRLAEGAQVSGDVSAVNGSAQLAKGVDIRGGLSNVNGKMTITAAHVGGGLKTVNGDITVGPDSRIEGGILVEKPNLNWFSTRSSCWSATARRSARSKARRLSASRAINPEQKSPATRAPPPLRRAARDGRQ